MMKKIEEEVRIKAIYVGDYDDVVDRIEEIRNKLNELVTCHNLLVKDYIRVLDRLTELETKCQL